MDFTDFEPVKGPACVGGPQGPAGGLLRGSPPVAPCRQPGPSRDSLGGGGNPEPSRPVTSLSGPATPLCASFPVSLTGSPLWVVCPSTAFHTLRRAHGLGAQRGAAGRRTDAEPGLRRARPAGCGGAGRSCPLSATGGSAGLAHPRGPCRFCRCQEESPCAQGQAPSHPDDTHSGLRGRQR